MLLKNLATAKKTSGENSVVFCWWRIIEDASWLDKVRDRMGNAEKRKEVKIGVEDAEDGKLEGSGSRWYQ